jgi:tetratricopeptide (TPR) repeat protein
MVSLASCKTASRLNSEESNKKGGLSEKQQTLLENFFIDGVRERLGLRYEQAESSFRNCLKLDPSNVAVKYELSNVLKVTGRIDEASKYAKECVDADPKNQWYHLAYIECLQYKKLYSQAAEAYEKLVKNFPDRSDFLEGMAIEYAMARNYSKSFKIYEDLEKRFGTNETFTLNKIKLLKEQKKFSEAEAELKALIESSPGEARFYSYLSEYYEEMNQPDKAKQVYDKILAIDPTNASVHLALADYYQNQDKADLAHNELKIAFANPELDVSAKINILMKYYQISDQYPNYTPKAYELCDILLKVHPTTPEAHSIYADFLYRDNKVEEARNHYLIAAYNDKAHFLIWDHLLEVDNAIHQYDSLEKHSAIALELFPNNARAYFFNGYANMRLRNYKKAAEMFNEGLEFVYEDKALMLEFYKLLGDSYNELKEFEKSDKAYEDALKVDPDNAAVLNNYSYSLSLRKEKLDRAAYLSKRSVELQPKNQGYMDTYGWILFQQGKYKESEEWLARAAKGSKDPVILEHYGDVLFKLGKKEEALNLWNQAKTAGGKSEQLLKKISEKKLYE